MTAALEQTAVKPITLLIIDDHKLLRETWSFLLNKDPRFSVLADCGSGEEAIELVLKFCPAIVIMDVNLPGISGFQATEFIRKYSPRSKVLGVSLHAQPSYAKKMMQHGASGYLTKNSTTAELFEAIIEIHNGNKYICKEIKNILCTQVISESDASTIMNTLSVREMEIIDCLKKGSSSKEIAGQLCISVKTVEAHRHNILRKLKLKNTATLINFVNQFSMNQIDRFF
jgi:DNA-binding NarL/FixJ family response regulator